MSSTSALFDVFSDDEEEEFTSHSVATAAALAVSSNKTTTPLKRQVEDDHEQNGVVEEDVDESLAKKSRLLESISKPIVTDEFGTSVSKEYAVSSNGLLGPAPTTTSGSTAPSSAMDVDSQQSNGQIDSNGVNSTSKNESKTEQLVVTHSVRHQVALPPNYDYVPLSKHIPPEKPARTYPFTLDPFQQTAIYSIQRNESVLVAAHTSAGKTVVAEYAIAQSLQNKQRVIYTSPIKALSNQKYRELLQEFGDVGLMTGDVTINPNSTCLVMTTEILRSMLYRGSEILREIAWVIFDEVHYMRDAERGVVWEETIILLPDNVHFVFLSATIPNSMQFAEWICKIHNQPCHIVYTDYRPTPLQHYLFPAGGSGIYLAVDEKSNFREENFQKAIAAISSTSDDKGKGKGGGRQKDRSTSGGSDLQKIIRMIMTKNYHPVIVFSFSKRECEAYALQVSKLDFNDDKEKELIKQVFDNAIQSLSEEDRALPQIDHILPLLKRGIGIHHSGLLPILKEVIEILFQEGLLKVLFATETFSIGLNMPAKTVVFTAARKFDGKETRWLGSGEYIQMSGRAGRRGLDDRGVVILMINESMEPAVAKGMLKGQADPLNSAYHLKYSMILNLLRVEGISPEYVLERSFYQFQNSSKLPELYRELAILEKRHSHMQVPQEETISDYYEIRAQLDLYKKDMRDVMNHPTYCLPFIQPGRLVRIKRTIASSSDQDGQQNQEDLDFGWGFILNFQKTYTQTKSGEVKPMKESEGPTYIVDVLLECAPVDNASVALHKLADVKPCPSDITKGDMLIVACTLDVIDGLSSVRVYTPKEVKSAESRNQLLRTLKEVKKRFPDGVPILDPIQDMKIKDESFLKLVKRIKLLEERLFSNALHNKPELPEIYELYNTKVQLAVKIRTLKQRVTQAESILQLDELKSRRRVLRRLGYINEKDLIEMKGRVACEISAGDELVLTEMIFNGSFNDLTVEQTVAMLSCFTYGESRNEFDTSSLPAELAGPFRTLQAVARRVAKVSTESKLASDERFYVNSFQPNLMEITYAWTQGAPFAQICKMSDIFEGSIIRAIRRLEELLRQLVTAAKAIGNTDLENKFAEGIVKIKRDIVFAASLYL